MEWLADNATDGYFLLAFAAFMLTGLWWVQKRLFYLIGAAAALVVLLVFWLVIRNVPTTAGHIENDLKSLAKALLDKDQAKAVRYVTADFKYNRKDREKWYAALEKNIAEADVDAIEVKDFKLNSRDGNEAKVDFRLIASHKGKAVFNRECPWKMVRDGDVWQVAKVSLKGGKAKSDDDD